MRELKNAATSNFDFLKQHHPLLAQLCTAAERNFSHQDPNTCLLKLRQFGEAIAHHLAAVFDLERSIETKQADLLVILQRRGYLDRSVADMLHLLRQQGNAASHGFAETPVSTGQALSALRVARELAVWFHRVFGKDISGFKPGPFQPPPITDYAVLTSSLEAQVALRTAEAQSAAAQAATEKARREQLEKSSALLASERATWEQLAQDEERERLRLQADFEAKLREIQAAAATQATAPSADSQPATASQLVTSLAVATSRIELDESETRAIIDAQLRAAGWEVDTPSLRYSKGARPVAGKNRAIAEWPTESGPADYVLFVGLVPMAVVEAKKFSVDVSTVVGQAERYSLGYLKDGTEQMHAGGWLAHHQTVTGATTYRIPFVFASNGRGYIRQLALGSPLIPFEQRVDRALKKIISSQAWTPPQQKWLERIAKSVKESVVVDESTFSKGAYANQGGFRIVNEAFKGKALDVIHQFEDAVWQDAA